MTATTTVVVDTSALVAILKAEAEAAALLAVLSQPGPRHLSSATLLETRIVLERQLGQAGQHALDLLLAKAGITTIPLEAAHVHWALEGWRRYGKGRHRAALNLGDCFSYGLARALEAPLLFLGNDFAATDLQPAWMG
ncbi:MAG: type II toxin-antitoxin system VapC family toxin [Cyanobium sp.]